MDIRVEVIPCAETTIDSTEFGHISFIPTQDGIRRAYEIIETECRIEFSNKYGE